MGLKGINSRANRFKIVRNKNNYWKKFVIGLSAVVVFCTTYSLVLPAIALQRDTPPDYPEYIATSDSKQGTTSVDEIQGQYWSDPSTSQLESCFDGVASDDGKVLTDKSVIYGKDDYGAFDSYAPNTFGVTLSALGQKYPMGKEYNIEAPVDVVFILDCSGSMTDNKSGNDYMSNIAVEALNKSMANVLNANPNNRVGVACFSGIAQEVLPLDRYTAKNDKYFNEGRYGSNSARNEDLTTSSSLKKENGASVSGAWTDYWGGTYTQAGIAMGAKIFEDVKDTTFSGTATYEASDGSSTTIPYVTKRKPVIILISDGEPTYCSPNYTNVPNNETSRIGTGSSGYNQASSNKKLQWKSDSPAKSNNQGIQGYYTILSANYYKDQVSKHYDTDAIFYTIGIGIGENSNDSMSISTSGDDYKRAILNPTAENINHLNSCTSGRCNAVIPPDDPNITDIDSNYRNISTFTEYTCRQLYRLLNNQYSGTTVTLDNNTKVSVIKNPYSSGYNYADRSVIIENTSVDKIVSSIKDFTAVTENIPVYGFVLKSNTSISISDTIGKGMEVKGELVLRYGAKNYSPAGHTTKGNTTIYNYSGTYVDPDTGKTVDLSKISAEVKDDNGQQTVRLLIPDNELPSYSPETDAFGKTLFYYEELPVRLIYQVGLSKESEDAVRKLDGTGNSLTFYTNEWSDTDYSFSEYEPTADNPYYAGNKYSKDPLPKEENTTSTVTNAWDYESGSNEGHAFERLGNNGKLTFTAEKFDIVSMTLNKADRDGNLITTDTATFELYKDQEMTKSAGTYTTDANGILVITTLRSNYTYYLKETKAPFGYKALENVIVFRADDSGKVQLMEPSNKNESLFVNAEDGSLTVKNDYASTEITVKKEWSGKLPKGEEYPSKAAVRLYQDGEPLFEPATLNAGNEWQYTWKKLPVISTEDKHAFEYTVQEENVPENYIASYSTDEDGKLIVTNCRISDTSLTVLKKWKGDAQDSVQVELLKNGEPTGQYATLDKSNDWYKKWDSLVSCDKNGEITYSVREIVPDGYESDIHLWTGKGDPYGQTGSEEWKKASNFGSGGTFLLTHKNKGYDVAVGVNTEENSPYMFDINTNELKSVQDNCRWKATVANGEVTLTNVATGQKLVLNSSNSLGLDGNNNHATTWKYDSSSRLYAQYYSRLYYYNADKGIDRWSATPITLYKLESTVAEDDCEKGDTHYIIVNTKSSETPNDLSLSFRKVNSETGSIVEGAKLALYRETGVETDVLITDTSKRYGKLVKEWTSNGGLETVTIDKNGTYYLVEKEAPKGYSALEEPIVFCVDSSGSTRTATILRHPELSKGTTISGTLDIPNTPDKTYELPETGGCGTGILYVFGLMLTVIAASCGLSIKSRKQ